MGGLMGAMSAVMMINDHLKVIGVIVFIIGLVILLCLNYMVYIESRNIDRKIKENQFITIVLSFILTIVTVVVMVFGPRSALFQ